MAQAGGKRAVSSPVVADGAAGGRRGAERGVQGHGHTVLLLLTEAVPSRQEVEERSVTVSVDAIRR